MARSMVEAVTGFAHGMRDFTREDALKLITKYDFGSGENKVVQPDEVRSFFLNLDRVYGRVKDAISDAYNGLNS